MRMKLRAIINRLTGRRLAMSRHFFNRHDVIGEKRGRFLAMLPDWGRVTDAIDQPFAN